MPEFKIKHLTQYTYQKPVRDSANQIILFPINDDYQTVQMHDLSISGDPVVYVSKDYYGNEVGNFSYSSPHTELVILSTIVVDTRSKPLPVDDMPLEIQWNKLQALKRDIGFIDFLHREHIEGMEALQSILSNENQTQNSPYQLALRYCKYVYENFSYIPGITTVETTTDVIWQLKAGVCQDFAHILLVMLRLASIPARYVSGYICPHKNGMRGEGATHAWVEAYIPDYGWLGLDPTNNCIANETHVRLAVGRNFSDCSPVKGVYKGLPQHKLEVSVSVSYEDDEDYLQELPNIVIEKATEDISDNSYRRYEEMQQQQQ
ncbi:transglutaminase-like putative cysteine protease [Arcticibacter pallidicorallinus]|uniref:Transglutaminase-like putative cysteine protease n=1 Tax=Arcticibacter pallidicorallinus TaxID=1259464 RepID=A0A2T0UAT5_9SPHI|nr:transglutaminase family protein [Arcticibacter pallidicorallinus]PRY55043.1 transglutaminase-like putative cysteine protease [Arcticibacter pallidicorallinus]